ncbi:Retrovirus-related Pol polyprotein from transposon RE2 [Vitis vinifera]|uniref:Retrovirus-related Pol polyprotein from transposon RE2 n=1 Tax=Vitis vinifera TaxID=29760 RepID=A0A438HVI4_VITVI|nr:Retrovirus-related Pol polyprotein from transposon RE2 [Vitis vinifera]
MEIDPVVFANHSQNYCASSQVPVANYTHGGSTMPWYPDTATNYHITPDLANLNIAHDYNEHDQLHVGNGQASQAPKDSSNFLWLHIKSVPPSSTGSVGNSAQSSHLTMPPSSHSPIPQQSPSSDSTIDPPLSLIVDLTHYPAQLNAASSTSTSPPRIHPMQFRSSTMQKQHACLSTKDKNYLITEPQTFTQAKPYAEWRNAMQSEINALLQNHTSILVPRPPIANIIGNKWVYRIKKKANGEIDRFKARIIGKDIFMEQPIGFQDSSHPDYDLGFQASKADSSLFILHQDQINLSSSRPWIPSLLLSPPLSKLSGDPLSNAEQYCQVPTQEHWTTVKRLLRYLKATVGFGLFFSKHSTLDLQCFTDSDWGGCPDDCRSTNGYAVYLGKNLISWTSKKQPTIAWSSTESEYRAFANSTTEIMWLRSLLSELGFSSSNPATLWCDNVGAIYLCSNPVFHARTKHIELDYHFIREQVQQRNIQVRFISLDDQIVDILTKPLGQHLFVKH